MSAELPSPNVNGPNPAATPSRARRKRYVGTHPRAFDERYKELAPEQFPDIHEHILAQGKTPAGTHVPVLLNEVMASLQPRAGDVVADCTLGYGGHAVEFLARIGPMGRLIGFDLDAAQLARAESRLRGTIAVREPTRPRESADRSCEDPVSHTGRSCENPFSHSGRPIASAVAHANWFQQPNTPLVRESILAPTTTCENPFSRLPTTHLFHMHFAGLAKVMRELGIDGYDVIFADLGVSSMQLDDPARGFSYKFDGPLDMRMDAGAAQSAADVLRTLREDELAAALDELADEPDHQRIARAIVRHRAVEPITHTRQLVRIIFEAKGISQRAWRANRALCASKGSGDEATKRQSHGGSAARRLAGTQLHPAALTFQALRILVNDELAGLSQLLRLAPHCLRPGGRVGIISFHSGEDRLVKKSFKEGLAAGLYESAVDSPIRPSPNETNQNPRSASAKLRWAKRPA